MDFPIVLSANLFPAQAFFNAMSDRSFVSTLEGFSKGIGAGFNDAVCEFPNEIEPGDEQFAGVKFYIFDEELVLSKLDFLRLLEQVCLIYLIRHPEQQALLSQFLDGIAKSMDDDD